MVAFDHSQVSGKTVRIRPTAWSGGGLPPPVMLPVMTPVPAMAPETGPNPLSINPVQPAQPLKFIDSILIVRQLHVNLYEYHRILIIHNCKQSHLFLNTLLILQ